MKKKLVNLLLVTVAIASLAGCGNQGATEGSDASNTQQQSTTQSESGEKEGLFVQEKTPVTAQTPLKDIKVDEYVNVPDYKTLEVSLPVPTEEEITENVKNLYQNMYPADLGIKDRAVAIGDLANIDYAGKKDGVAFDGGTAQGFNLGIGTGQFIDGFEDGLVGVMPGETVDLNLKFPEAYGNQDLAGQEVVFTVTVNYIVPSEIDEEVIAQMGLPGISNLQEMRAYVEDYMNSYMKEDAENKIMNALMSACTFDELPTVLVDLYKDNLRKNMEDSAHNAGMELDKYMLNYYGMDIEAFLNRYSSQSLQLNMACQSIANTENLTVSDEELDKLLKENAEQAGVSVEDYMGTSTKEDFRDYFMYRNVVEYLTNIYMGES